MFTKLSHNVNTRQQSNLVKEYDCKRYQKSSFPYLAKLLNTKQKKQNSDIHAKLTKHTMLPVDDRGAAYLFVFTQLSGA